MLVNERQNGDKVIASLAWSIGLLAVFIVLAALAYNRKNR
jgi:hypothetical protein